MIKQWAIKYTNYSGSSSLTFFKGQGYHTPKVLDSIDVQNFEFYIHSKSGLSNVKLLK